MSRRIFIVDDEPDMLKIAADVLAADGYMVTSDTRPTEALKKIKTNPPDLIMLDVRMPDLDGFQMCRMLKADIKTRHVPVVMVSVRAEEMDVVVGLEIGADDYISKPFRKRELLARVKTALRRVEIDPQDQKLSAGPISVDYGTYKAFVNNKLIPLTPKEFELLGFFIRREGRVVTRAVLSENVWSVEFTGSTRTIDVHVDQVRKKLGKYGSYIHSLKGVGYRFEIEE